MTDSLTVFGTDFTGVTGIKAMGTGNGTLTYIRPQGNLAITQNTASGSTLDVAQYATATVNVSGGGMNCPTFSATFDSSTGTFSNVTCDKTYAECVQLWNGGMGLAIIEFDMQGETFTIGGTCVGDESQLGYMRYTADDGGLTVLEITYNSNGTASASFNPSSLQSLSVTENDTYNAPSGVAYTEVVVAVPSSSPSLQSKNATPTESQQTIEPDSGYDGLSSVTVGAISSSYVGSGVDRNDSTDLTASGATVSVPAGYYAEAASKAVATGTVNTPSATKGTVSNHSVSVTPSVNVYPGGYVSSGVHNGTAVTVSASELVSGTYTVDSSGTKDVTNYASASVPAGTAGTPSASKGTVSNHSVSVTPSVTNQTGWITGSTKTGTAVTVSASELVSGSETKTANGTYDVTNLASLVVNITYSTIYTGTGNPSSSQGSNGDVYLKTVS